MTEAAKSTAPVKPRIAELSPGLLNRLLSRVPRLDDPNSLPGFDSYNSAGLYRLTPRLAIVQTVTFLPPVVDDAYTAGAIAASNALSSVFAMGATPLSALAIVGWPPGRELGALEQMLSGGGAKRVEAGCALIGGQSTRDTEIKIGYAVTGTLDPQRIWRSDGAHAGDGLYITKPIGTGIVSAAKKRGFAATAHVEGAISSMLRLNRPREVIQANACTDVGAFGLLGHARQMALASNVTIEITSRLVPMLPGAAGYASAGESRELENNRNFVEDCVEFRNPIDPNLEALLYDPQTSGGLLIASSESVPEGWRIGTIRKKMGKPIIVL